MALLGGDGSQVRTAQRGEDVLRRGLAGRARDADDAGAAAITNGLPERRHRRVRVVGHERGRRSPGHCVVDVRDAAADRYEQVPGAHPARVDLEAGHRLRTAGRLEPARAELVRPRSSASRITRRAPAASRRNAAPASSRSEKGTVRSARIWPCSCPFPAITTTSPSPASATAWPIAARRSGSAWTSAGPARVPAEDLVDDGKGILGARVVGRDDHTVGQPRRDLSHERALAAVPVAPAAEHASEPPAADLARRGQHALERVGCVRVVDQNGERLTLVHGLEPARDSSQVLDAPTIASSGSSRSLAAPIAPRTFATLKRPRRRVRISRPSAWNAAPACVSSSAVGANVGVRREPERDQPTLRPAQAPRPAARPYASPMLTAAGGRRASGPGLRKSCRFAS